MAITLAILAAYSIGLISGLFVFHKLQSQNKLPSFQIKSQASTPNQPTDKPYDVIVLTPEYESKVLNKVDADVKEKWIR